MLGNNPDSDSLIIMPYVRLTIAKNMSHAMTELDDRVTRFAILNLGARPDVNPTIRYLEQGTAAASVLGCLPLFRSVRRLTTTSRPLQATDLTLMNEATSGTDSQRLVDKTRLDLVLAAMQTLRNDFAAVKAGIDAPLGDQPARFSCGRVSRKLQL
jgi:hypothetical protein